MHQNKVLKFDRGDFYFLKYNLNFHVAFLQIRHEGLILMALKCL